MMDPRVKPAGDGPAASSSDDSPQQVARRIERNEGDAFLREIFLGALQPIDEGDDLRNARAAIAHRAHRLHHRSAPHSCLTPHASRRRAVARLLSMRSPLVVAWSNRTTVPRLEVAVGLSLGAVVFYLLAHHE